MEGYLRGVRELAARAGVDASSCEPVRFLTGFGARNPDQLSSILDQAESIVSGLSVKENAGGRHRKCKAGDRLRPLFENVSIDNRRFSPTDPKGFALAPLSAESIYPKSLKQLQQGGDPKKAYAALLDGFSKALSGAEDSIPVAFRKSGALWLDSFDSAWLTFAHGVPTAIPGVSLYDESRATAAMAVALWRWETETGEKADAEHKFLLIQADFFGIQQFIFSGCTGETNKKSAKILRGRSFFVSLVCELAALRLLEELELPASSQLLNAAGKFLILAPNTKKVAETVDRLRDRIAEWFVDNTFATAGLGLATTPAGEKDFLSQNYHALTSRLFHDQERVKYQRFDLTRRENSVLPADFSNGVCAWQPRMPADGVDDGGLPSCAMSRDQLLIGKCLTKFSRILVVKDTAPLVETQDVRPGRFSIFGYRIGFAQDVHTSGRFGNLVESGDLVRCWEFALPERWDETLWHGCARRNINAFVPCYSEAEMAAGADEDAIKTFEDLAACDSFDGKGIHALMILKGDVDNLGQIFHGGLEKASGSMAGASFVKTSVLSRQLNSFFAICLPTICAVESGSRGSFRNMYSVFAGGDDFFLVGPWHTAQEFALRLRGEFSRYVADNPLVHFSAGLVMTKESVPPYTFAEMAEAALSNAKDHEGKDAVQVYQTVVSWPAYEKMRQTEDKLREYQSVFDVSASYYYSLFSIIEMHAKATAPEPVPEANGWRSLLYYGTTRLFARAKRGAQTAQFIDWIQGCINDRGLFIPLCNVFYSIRSTRRD